MSRHFKFSRWPRLALSVALCGAFWVAPLSPARAQPAKPKVPASAATSPVASPSASPASPSPLPFLIAGALGGVIVGAGLAWSLKKSPAPVAVEAGPGAAFDATPFPLAILDAGERITRANAAFARFLGAPDVAGQSLPPFFHPDDLAMLRVGIASVFDGDQNEFYSDARFFRPDGALLHTKFGVTKQGEKRKPSSVLVALQDVTQQVAAQSDLTGARAAVSALSDVIGGDRARSLDAKMKALLAMGCGRLELPIGVLGRICDDQEGERLETLFVHSPDRRVRPAMTLYRAELQKGVTTESKLLGLETLPRAGTPPKGGHVECNDEIAYLGAPVAVEGKTFGMLSFAATQPRARAFEASDGELLRLMAEWVGGEIERENARAVLAQQQRELLEANGQLESLATHDALTGAKNRRAFDEKIAEEWARALRYGTPLSLVMFDVDKFKSYNDTHGHQAGDGVLKILARTVTTLVRGTDFFARYGGEEFALILPNTDAEGALILAERLRERVEKAAWKERPVTASFGVSCVAEGMTCREDLIERADAALYQSKENGRNRVTVAHDVAASEVAS